MRAEIFCCPRCKSPKLSAKSANEMVCGACQASIPSYDGLWCFESPAAFQTQWRARFRNQEAATRAREKLTLEKLTPEHPPLTRQRLTRVFDSQRKNLQRIYEMLPELLAGDEPNSSLMEVAAAKISKHQTFDAYHANIFRDWVWGDKENSETLATIMPFIEAGDKTIAVLGSGSGRLATDIAGQSGGEVFAVDNNPFLLRIHALMATGEPVDFDEVPVNPRSLDTVTVSHHLKGRRCTSVYPIIMNALNPSFRRGSLDVIVASWFVDVVPEDFLRLSARLNSLLKSGGKLIIHGPLGYSNPSEVKAYSKEEICQALELTGYQISENRVLQRDYLHSEYNPQKRVEEIKLIVARKVKSAKDPAEFKLLPDWLVNSQKAIPISSMTQNLAGLLRVSFEVMSLIDGHRSFDDIVPFVERQYKIPRPEARALVMNILADLFEPPAT